MKKPPTRTEPHQGLFRGNMSIIPPDPEKSMDYQHLPTHTVITGVSHTLNIRTCVKLVYGLRFVSREGEIQLLCPGLSPL